MHTCHGSIAGYENGPENPPPEGTTVRWSGSTTPFRTALPKVNFERNGVTTLGRKGVTSDASQHFCAKPPLASPPPPVNHHRRHPLHTVAGSDLGPQKTDIAAQQCSVQPAPGELQEPVKHHRGSHFRRRLMPATGGPGARRRLTPEKRLTRQRPLEPDGSIVQAFARDRAPLEIFCFPGPSRR